MASSVAIALRLMGEGNFGQFPNSLNVCLAGTATATHDSRITSAESFHIFGQHTVTRNYSMHFLRIFSKWSPVIGSTFRHRRLTRQHYHQKAWNGRGPVSSRCVGSTAGQNSNILNCSGSCYNICYDVRDADVESVEFTGDRIVGFSAKQPWRCGTNRRKGFDRGY